jgi:hypothetical protein
MLRSLLYLHQKTPERHASCATASANNSHAGLLEAFDLTAVYDKVGRTLELGATVTPEPGTPGPMYPDRG